MKNVFRLFLASFFAVFGSMLALAQTEEFAGKIIKLGGNATTLETGQWYVLYNANTSSFTFEGAGNTLGVSTTSPNNSAADTNAGYLVQLEETGTENQYYIKSGLGNYYANVTTTKNNGTNAQVAAKYAYTIAQISSGHWTLRSNNLYYLQNNSGKLIGSSSAGGSGSDRDWVFRTVTFTSLDELTGKAYVNYVLSSTNIVRITSRRNTNVRLADNGTNTIGASKNDNTLAQVWLLSKSGSGYTLRNANTGRFLNDDDNFRSPSNKATTIYIQFSPNNGTDEAFINLAEEESFSGNVSLNLGTDGTTLYKWNCQGDKGCDWSIALVDNYTMQEVEDNLLAVGGYSEPVVGKYYRIKNAGKLNYITEDISANTLSCEGKDAEKLAQYWTLVQATGGRYYLQNVCTQRFITQQNGTLSRQYRTALTKSSASFNIQRSDDATALTFYIIDSGTAGLHCDGSNNVVGWTYTNDNSVWGFEVAELDEEFIQSGRAQLAAFTDLQKNLSTYKAALANLFQDNACTILKDEIQALSDEALAENADFATLSDDIKAMVLKVKNNTWQSFTASNGYTREGFEKFFRVRDDFNVYSNYESMAWKTGMSNTFGKLSGPTGIVGKAGDIIYIYVDQAPITDCTLQAEVVVDSDSPGDHMTGNTTTLKAGLNVILMSTASTLYIFYQLNDTSKPVANYPAAKIHIEGGQLQGYFDYTRGMTNQDWTLLYEKMLDKSKVVNLKCDRLVFVMLTSLVKNAIGKTGEVEGLMRVWNNFIECEEDLMGFKDEVQGRFRNIWNASSVNHGYMYATTYGTYYSDGTISTVMNYNTITTSGGAIWGPSHEIGHNHQSCINIVGATEVSNNLFSNVNVFLQGISTTRGSKASDTFEDFAKGKGWFEMSIWEQTRFYYQLYLYFHAQGHKPDFYPTLFKLLRNDPIQKRTGPSDATLTDGDGNVVGGRITYGKTDYLHMAKKMCDAAQLDLSELFEVNGMFVPYEKKFIGDYSNYWVTTTEQDIKDAKAYMARYPKAPSICFIEDRIKPSPVVLDNPFEGKTSSATRMAYDSGEAPTGYADVGQWSDFVDEYQTNGYYYTTSTSSGLTTYNINGEGAIGFKVYDKDGNLIYLSNKKKMTPPSVVAEKMKNGFKIVACEANGYEVLVSYGPAMYRGELTAYYEGDQTPHTLYYYGTGTAGISEINPLPANSIAYVKEGQTAKKQPTAGLLENVNVVDAEGNAQSLVIDGDKPFYVPTDFTAQSLTFTKSGEGYQALRLPFDTWAGLGVITENGSIDSTPETYAAGQPVVFQDKVNITENGRTIAAGTFAETERGYILSEDGKSFVFAEGISPFTYVWEEGSGIESIQNSKFEIQNADGIYNIAGQRMQKLQKGVNIVGGKKVLVK